MQDPRYILLVDDQETDQFIAKRNLKRHWPGATVVTALDGEEAIELLEADMDNLPDLILLDINMPRMNGHEFLKNWASKYNLDIPVVVMLTSSDQELDRQQTQEYRCVRDYVLKPLDKNTITCLAEILND